MNPFRDWLTESLELVLVTLEEEVRAAELTLRVIPGEIVQIKEELKKRNDVRREGSGNIRHSDEIL